MTMSHPIWEHLEEKIGYSRNHPEFQKAISRLQNFHLNFNQIVDLSPLAQLQQLQTLDLANNQIVDLRPLAQLQELEALYLENNQIVDISPLAQLQQLKILCLSNNPIQDFPKNLNDLKMMKKMQQVYYRTWLARKWPLAYQERLHLYILDALLGSPQDLLVIKGIR